MTDSFFKRASTNSVPMPVQPGLEVTPRRSSEQCQAPIGRLIYHRPPLVSSDPNIETSSSQNSCESLASLTRQSVRDPVDQGKVSVPATRRPSNNPLVGYSSNLMSMPSDFDVTNSPLRIDSTLKTLIEVELDQVNSHRSFKLWRSSFLNCFEAFLSKEGTPLAEKQYLDFGGTVKTLDKYVTQMQAYVERGDLSLEKTTVRGRNALNEMNKCLVQVMEQERDLIPARSIDEKRLGYSKFHLGAVLVRDGFREHERLHHCHDILRSLKESSDLVHIADRQQLDEIDNFEKQLVRFRDIMYDIGLLEVMLKSRQFGNPEDELIFVDLKTGAIGTITVGSCLERKLLTKGDLDAEYPFREALVDKEERQSVLDLVKEVLANYKT